jgi:hypothetical protein
MDCAECRLLADQASVAEEEIQKIRDRIVADFSLDSASPALVKSLEAAERTREKCIAAVKRHGQSHHAVSSGFRVALHV